MNGDIATRGTRTEDPQQDPSPPPLTWPTSTCVNPECRRALPPGSYHLTVIEAPRASGDPFARTKTWTLCGVECMVEWSEAVLRRHRARAER